MSGSEESLGRGEIQERHARPLLKIPDKAQRLELWHQIRNEKLSTRAIEQKVRAALSGEATPEKLRAREVLPQETDDVEDMQVSAKLRAREVLPAPATPMPDLVQTNAAPMPQEFKPTEEARLIAQLTQKFAARVSVQRSRNGDGGQLAIGFHDNHALRELARRLLAL